MRSSGVPYAYEDTKVHYTLECDYNPDFHLLKSNIFIETKGLLSPEDRRKHLTLQKQQPELDVRFVFMMAEKRIPGMKSTHAAWASKHGFKWADGKIPQEWLDE